VTIYVDVVGTEPFFDNWSGGNDKLSSVASWCEGAWRDHVEDGSGDYYASFTSRDRSTVEIPSSALDCCDTSERGGDADRWLQNNYGYYDSADAIVAVDWWGAGSDYGIAYDGGAGSAAGITALADAYYEDTGNLNAQYDGVGTEGVAAHENGHLFAAVHTDTAATSSENVSLMYGNDGEAPCYANGALSQVVQWYSTCGVSSIRDHVDANL
jgi:hypothetical protein